MFAENLRIARTHARLSQKELADKIFISQQAYAKYELGTSSPNPETIKLISQELDVPSDVLIGTSWTVFIKNHPTHHAMIVNVKNPLPLLVAQYKIKPVILYKCIPLPSQRIEEMLKLETELTKDEYNVLSNFFDIPIDYLMSGTFPLYPDPKIQKKLEILTEARFSKHVELDQNYLCITTRTGEYKDYNLTDEQLDAIERILAQMPKTITTPIGEIAAQGGALNRPEEKDDETTL